jgi:glycosyltransferase involved in cell wall biosynthesis
MKISALVVTLNEEKRLCQCLQSLSFCDQLVVVDLGSTDRSPQIAAEFATTFIAHAPVPIVEEIWAEMFDTLTHDWILRVDPDEILTPGLIPLIAAHITGNVETGAFTLPYICYFRDRPLAVSVWGGLRRFTRLFHKNRIQPFGRVHAGYSLKNGFRLGDIPYDGQNTVQHYWADTYRQLFQKHRRYLKKEGQSRYEQGLRFSWSAALYATAKACYISLIQKRGWRSLWSGWFLSFFYAVYELRSWGSLRSYVKSLPEH